MGYKAKRLSVIKPQHKQVLSLLFGLSYNHLDKKKLVGTSPTMFTPFCLLYSYNFVGFPVICKLYVVNWCINYMLCSGKLLVYSFQLLLFLWFLLTRLFFRQLIFWEWISTSKNIYKCFNKICVYWVTVLSRVR